ncbi:MAG TPA: DUF2125 domain-containing protein [Rhizomicrobium sp.]
MRYSSRFFLYAPFVWLLLLAGIAAVHWWIVASAWAKYLDAANGHEIMPGVRMSFAQKRIAGFPFRTDTILKNLSLQVAEADGPVIWTTENFAMHELTYGRVQAIFEAAGRQTLSWTDAHSREHRFAFLPGTFRASSILADGRLIRFDSQIVGLDGQDFSAAEGQLHFRVTNNGVDVFLSLRDAHIRDGYAATLGPSIDNLTVNGTLDHASKLQPALSGDQAPQNALEEWRQAGGALAVKDATLTRHKAISHFNGKLALDSNHNLVGVLAGATPNANHFAVLNFAGSRLVSSGLARP